jgi:hypothetical protein
MLRRWQDCKIVRSLTPWFPILIFIGYCSAHFFYAFQRRPFSVGEIIFDGLSITFGVIAVFAFWWAAPAQAKNPNLRSLLAASWIIAGLGCLLPLMAALTNELSVNYHDAISIGTWCFVACTVIAAFGIMRYRRPGLWLLVPLVPAFSGPALAVAFVAVCSIAEGGC